MKITGQSSSGQGSFFTQQNLRLLLFGVLILIAFAAMWIKLGIEQLQSAEERTASIARQSVRRIRVPARRGKILTSDLKLLAGNSAEGSIVFYPQEMRERRRKTVDVIYDAAGKIAQAIGRSNPLTKEEIARHLNMRPGLPLTVFRQLSPLEIGRALESSRSMRGVNIEPDESRTYPEGKLACHLIGYTNLESPQKASDRQSFSYYIPDRIGVEGVERAFDRLPGTPEPGNAEEEEDVLEPGSPGAPLGLRGLPGYSLVQVDHLGYPRQTLVKSEPRHGNNLVMTIDSRAQKIAEETIAGKRAAIVVLDASNGDVIASASSPAYDLSEGFSPFIRGDYYRKLRENSDRPLYNRAFLGSYTPGSILKPLVELAFLEAGVSPDDVTICDGGTKIGNTTVRCASWRSGGHGPVNMYGALEKSCNDYMLEHGMRVGREAIAHELEAAGIGRKTGVELSEERGVFPDPEEKRKRGYGNRWTIHDTALLSMGQGIITLSPLQAAVFTAAIANGGTLWKPHVASKVVDAYGNPLFSRKPEETGKLAATPAELAVIRRGMYDVINSPTGSGKRAKVDGLELHGKTGSAEVGPANDRVLTTWFISFVTYQGRTYACAVMVEEGKTGSGGRDCAPLAAEFFRRYLLERAPVT